MIYTKGLKMSKEVEKEIQETKKTEWQQKLDSMKEICPVQYRLLTSKKQKCVVVAPAEKGVRLLQAYSLVWGDGVKDNDFIEVKCNNEDIATSYYASSRGDIIIVESNYNYNLEKHEFVFKGNESIRQTIREFEKSELSKEVKAKDIDKVVKRMKHNRISLQNIESSYGVDLIR